MKHADWLIQRILFLDGLPNVQRLNRSRSARPSRKSCSADLRLEEKALDDLREAIAYCESVRDFVSRDLLMHILESEEDHVDFLDRQFDLIKQIGVERYILLNAASAPDQEDGHLTGRSEIPQKAISYRASSGSLPVAKPASSRTYNRPHTFILP